MLLGFQEKEGDGILSKAGIVSDLFSG